MCSVLCTCCLLRFFRCHSELAFAYICPTFDNLYYKCPTIGAIFVLPVLIFDIKLSYFPTYWNLKGAGRYHDAIFGKTLNQGLIRGLSRDLECFGSFCRLILFRHFSVNQLSTLSHIIF